MSKTHWKKLTNPNYIGAYVLLPGQEIILTIEKIQNEEVTSPEGKKEICSVLYFKENVKPMILNVTTFKTIANLFKTPYIEEWSGRKIQIYVESVKAFGSIVDALRIRPFLPVDKNLICACCGENIKGYGDCTAETVAKHTLSKYGKMLCSECATKAALEKSEAQKDEGVL